MKIKLTAETRVLLSAGTIVDVDAKTAAAIHTLGRCVYVKDTAEKKKAEKVEQQLEPEKVEKPKKASKTTKN